MKIGSTSPTHFRHGHAALGRGPRETAGSGTSLHGPSVLKVDVTTRIEDGDPDGAAYEAPDLSRSEALEAARDIGHQLAHMELAISNARPAKLSVLFSA